MKITGKNLSSSDIIKISKEFNGCYAEYTYSKDLHTALIEDGAKYQFNKKDNVHEFVKELNSEYTEYRIYLR